MSHNVTIFLAHGILFAVLYVTRFMNDKKNIHIYLVFPSVSVGKNIVYYYLQLLFEIPNVVLLQYSNKFIDIFRMSFRII